MKTLPSIASLAVAFATRLYAQSVAPELEPLTAKRKAELANLEAQKVAAFTRVQQPYLAALDGAERIATTAGTLETVAAISRERDAMKSGLMAPAFPADLPKTLQSPRKSYLDGVARITVEQIARQKAADTEYLRALAALQSKAARDPDLAKQIAAEKQQLLAAVASSPSAPTRSGQANKRNVVVNGTFDLADPDGRPTGWRLPDSDAASFKVVRDGTNSVLRITATGAPRTLFAEQEIPISPNTKNVTFKARIRGKWVEHNTADENWGATLHARCLDADGKQFGDWTILIGGRDPGWKTFSKTAALPAGAKSVKVSPGAYWVTGIFDFDDIEVEFR